MDGRFEGKVVLVTGGNRNTGLAIVERFAREGAKVYMCGSSEESTAKGASALAAMGVAGVTSQACDISDAAQVGALMDTISRESGRLDVLVNNAANQGLGHGGPLEMEPERFWDVLKTNVVGGFRVTQAACNRFFMKQESRGVVVFLSSNTAMRAIPLARARLGSARDPRQLLRPGIHIHRTLGRSRPREGRAAPPQLSAQEGGVRCGHRRRRGVPRVGRLREHDRRDRHVRRGLLVPAHAGRCRRVKV